MSFVYRYEFQITSASINNRINSLSGSSGDTGSLLLTASFSNPNLTFIKGNGSTFPVNLSTLVPTFASTASYVNNLNQAVTIGDITNTPSTENTLNVYPPFAGGTGEGGQILLAASGGIYTTASMLDTWQNNFRILKGSNASGSTDTVLTINLQTNNATFAGSVTATSFSGLPNTWLYATRNSSQTIGSSNKQNFT
jgi:hypothetical protein